MDEKPVKVYGYRWIVLAAFMFIAAMTQVLWITFAPITSRAAQFYGTSDLLIGLFSLSFMAIYVLIVIPSAWIIDTWGLRKAVGLGASLTAIFSLTRGIFASNFTLVLVSQIGIAIGQPLVLGSITKLAARWFPIKERATAVGLGTVAIYIGILTGMVATPVLTISYDIKGMLWIYGIIATLSAIAFVAIAREHPPTPPCPPGQEERALMLDGLKSMLRQKNFILLLIIFFIGLGIFNGISTWIEAIVRPRGFSISQAGILGGMMLIGGIIGAFIMPMISDKLHRRKPFIIIALIGLIPGLMGITFATRYWLLLFSGFFFGFFLLSAGPIGFQYGAEITHPAPEGTSNSLLLVMGQISGIIIIFGMDAIKTVSGSMSNSLLLLIGLAVANLLFSTLLRESPVRNTG